MKAVPVHNSPHLSLWKSAAAEAIAQQSGIKGKISAVSDHPMLHGIDCYADAMINNQAIPAPGGGDVGINYDDPQVIAYLSMLNHQAVHAKIHGDTQWQNQINRQRSRFKYGNPLWQQQWIQYFWYYWDYPYHKGRAPNYRSWQDPAFGNNDPSYGVIKWKIPADATIALIGDIGTGTDIAASVLYSAMKFKPDVILHVGDIYYSGTSFEFQHRFIGLYQEVMKQFDKPVPMFTIPGNHEYFTGAIGFFQCLDSMQIVRKPDQRQEASYFSLTTEDEGWQFLAMDTGYYGHFMDVSKQQQEMALKLLHHEKIDVPNDPSNPHWMTSYNPHFLDCKLANNSVHDPTSKPPMITIRTDELAWHEKQLGRFQGNTILLSHHQLYSATQHVGGDPTKANDNHVLPYVNTDLWRQFGPYLETKVAAWFWGHEHNLGIYENAYYPSAWPANLTDYPTLKKGRCVGHAAIPVMEKEQPYAEKYPVPLVTGNPKLGLTNGWYNRGYQIMKLNGKDQPIQTSYYQIEEADPEPILLFSEDIK